jgi:hypothetical protein
MNGRPASASFSVDAGIQGRDLQASPRSLTNDDVARSAGSLRIAAASDSGLGDPSALAAASDAEAELTNHSFLLSDVPLGAFWGGLRFEDEFGNPVDRALIQIVSSSGVDWSRSFAPEVGSTVPVPATAALALLAIGLMGWRRSRERSDIDPASQTVRALI